MASDAGAVKEHSENARFSFIACNVKKYTIFLVYEYTKATIYTKCG